MQYLSIEKTLLPVSMFVMVEGIQYEFIFNYNYTYDFFTVTLRLDEQDIVTGEKMLIEKPLFTSYKYPFESTCFIPYDLSEQAERITYDNFMDTVYLYRFELDDEGEIIDE